MSREKLFNGTEDDDFVNAEDLNNNYKAKIFKIKNQKVKKKAKDNKKLNKIDKKNAKRDYNN
jgi:hypothetical protein